jgi:transcriptional regulator with XRE-family HTH domain
MSGPELREARVALKLTQSELAGVLRKTVPTIAVYEHMSTIPRPIELSLRALTLCPDLIDVPVRHGRHYGRNPGPERRVG